MEIPTGGGTAANVGTSCTMLYRTHLFHVSPCPESLKFLEQGVLLWRKGEKTQGRRETKCKVGFVPSTHEAQGSHHAHTALGGGESSCPAEGISVP